jgi:nicotinate-nucleotide adenylyltransferase
MTPGPLRVEMLLRAIAAHPAFSVSRHEVDRGGVNYTVDTLTYFQEQSPGAELFFLMGADMLIDLPGWREADRVCRLAIPVVAGRAGRGPLAFDCLEPIATPERIEEIRRHQVEMPEIGISATDLRRRVVQRRSIRYQTPAEVEAFIHEQGLYREG